jgi:hypothetical protein
MEGFTTLGMPASCAMDRTYQRTTTACCKIYYRQTRRQLMVEDFNGNGWTAATLPFGNKEANPATE